MLVHCGCWCFFESSQRYYLPQVDLQAHTTILSTASRTKLTQTFVNNTADKTPEVRYTFPIYDGVSVVSFKCIIGDKTIVGIVKEKEQARQEYTEAKSKGIATALLEQLHESSDVFTTKIGSIPKDGKAVIEIEYIGELKHDAQLDGVRFMIPTAIAPRYGNLDNDSVSSISNSSRGGKIEIVVDVEVDEGTQIEGLSSPSHPIAMTLGRTSSRKDTFKGNRASATLSLGSAELKQDFVIIVNAQDQGIPKALLEDHPEIPHHRALMTTLVPRFNLPSIHPEIVFVVDRSGSMMGKIPTLVEALKVFLKSLPLSAKFNICSFGSNFTFLFDKSKPYDEKSLDKALKDVAKFDANYGGTELLDPIREAVKRRLKGTPLEIMVLTDGEIWNTQEAFDFVNEAAKSDVRLFSLGIGAGASTALVEGLARAGNGFAQFVKDNEKMDKMVVRMLKAALSPHITNYQLVINYDDTKYDGASEDDFEMVETASTAVASTFSGPDDDKSGWKSTPISLFDPNFTESSTKTNAGPYDHLPKLNAPKELPAPNTITALFPFNRTTVYVLLPDSTRNIKSATLRGVYNSNPVELEIPVQRVGEGKTIHQLAAKKAMLETEEGRGWLSTATTTDNIPYKMKYAADWDRIVEREAVTLGVKFQIAGKFCSFVAVERDPNEKDKVRDTFDPSLPEQMRKDAEVAQRIPQMAAGGGNRFSGGVNVRARAAAAPKSMAFSAFSASTAPGGAIPPPPPGSSFGARGGMFGSNSSSPAPQQALFGSPAPSTGTQPDTFRSQLFSKSAAPSAFSFGETRSKAADIDKCAESSNLEKEQEVSFDTADFGFGRASRADDMRKRKTSNSFKPTSLFGRKSSGSEASPAAPAKRESGTSWGGLFSRNEKPAADHSPATVIADTVEAKLHRIIGLQSFNGSWNASDELFKLTDTWKGDFEAADLKYEDETIKATILAIAWLEKVAAKEVEVWEMVVEKAKAWLAGTHNISTDAVNGSVRQAIAAFFP